jgi:hypothetical protein
MQGPIFIKGSLDFVIDGIKWEFSPRNISIHGASGLPWSTIPAARNFGRVVSVNLHFQVPKLTTLRIQASVTREKSAQGHQFGLKFIHDPISRSTLSDLLLVYGFYPSGFIRKYPRIPMSGYDVSLPLLVVGTIPARTNQASSPNLNFEAKNLSLGGILVTSSEARSLEFRPGNRMDLRLALRSEPSAQTLVDGMVCRVTDELRADTEQLFQYVALKFIRVYEDSRQGLLKMLKYILEQLERQTAFTRPDLEDTQ